MPAVNPGDNHVDPKIRRRHPELDAQQLRFIGHGEGPLLGLAGPGAGKTRCIELRASNLLLTGRVSPEELTLCTFGKPAARELRERFLASAQALGCGGDAARVRIATIHSLCHQILVPHARALGLDPPYRLLDQDDQGRLMRESVRRHLRPGPGRPGEPWLAGRARHHLPGSAVFRPHRRRADQP